MLKIFDTDLVAIGKSKGALTLSKPVYLDMCLLDMTKLLMWKFHYDYIKNEYSNNSRLLFTDTDSVMYKSKAEDVFEHFSTNKEMFDFSNYSAESKYYDDSDKTVVGKMNDETGDFTIKEFVGLKSKICSFLEDNTSEGCK